MEEKELKTSPKQRIFITLIAVIMLGSMIASYAAIILNGNGSSNASSSDEVSEISEEKAAEYEEAYNKVVTEFTEKTKNDYDEFIAYKSEIKAYNETSANDNGLQIKDLKEGSGDVVKSDGSNYLAYYVGWCADESVFDSTLDDSDDPSGFAKVLDPSLGMIEGWTQGVEGMKIGGVRRIKNKPLRFLVMAVERSDSLKKLSDELDTAYMRYQYAQYGLDYDSMGAEE